MPMCSMLLYARSRLKFSWTRMNTAAMPTEMSPKMTKRLPVNALPVDGSTIETKRMIP